MFSDNGTNFVGAQRFLREELDKLKGDGVLVIGFKDLGIEWFFQPASSCWRPPHFGGSHEKYPAF